LEFYDAHLHILFKCRPSDLQNRLDFLKGIGVKGFCAIITPEFPGDVNIIREMIPEVYYSIQDLEVLCKQEHILPIIRQVTNPDIIPYIDARYIGTDIERKMEKYHGQGYVGLKLLYVPEEDNVSKIHGMARAFGRPPAESERITADLIACAARYGMPVLIHLDLRRYAGFMTDMLEGYPQTHFNIAHFGYYRKMAAKLLDKYPNCWTDIASLVPGFRKDQKGYLDFIRHYQERVLFGSDALIEEPEIVQKAAGFFLKRLADPQLIDRVFYKNYLEFHGRHD
jgi:hypothetical protein